MKYQYEFRSHNSMIKIKNDFWANNYLILILLAVHFLINIAIYFNTNSFYEISESRAIFDSYYLLLGGETFLPIHGYYFLTPAFIAFYISQLTGNGLFNYFIFQIVLSTIVVYVIYKVILHITKSNKHAITGVLLLLFYLEFHLLGSIFYNQIYEIFFVSLFLLLIIVFYDESKVSNLLLLALSILIILFASMFFRKTLFYILSIFIFLSLFNFKNKTNLIKFSILTILSFILLFLYNPYKMFNSNYSDETTTLFWGHTFYGGLGGESGFIFPENEKRYDERFKQYIKDNKIDSVTTDVIKQFRISEIKSSIINEPHKWLFLQVKKVFYTFGSVPQKDGLLMLYKGKVRMPWTISALIIQLSYAIILLMFLITVDLNIKKIVEDKYKRIIYFIGLYLIGGICIFSAYQERYRSVVFICFFIPVIAINLGKFRHILLKENRRELIIKLVIILILLAVWIYQAYEALYIYHDRYFKVVE
jgi:hypothetical protein